MEKFVCHVMLFILYFCYHARQQSFYVWLQNRFFLSSVLLIVIISAVEQRKQPYLRGLPTAVVQYNSWKGGGLIAVGYEARKFGVKRYRPFFL